MSKSTLLEVITHQHKCKKHVNCFYFYRSKLIVKSLLNS